MLNYVSLSLVMLILFSEVYWRVLCVRSVWCILFKCNEVSFGVL